MVRPTIAIVQGQHEQTLAAVRARLSELREAEVQIVKTQKRLDAVSKAAEMRRLELGKALAAARDLWPSSRAMMGGARGPGGTTWIEWLASEGIAESTAERYLKTAGWTPSLTTRTEPDIQPRESSTSTKLVSLPDQPQAFALLAGFDLRLGDWQTQLARAGTVDALITDPPFGAATHAGSRALSRPREDGSPLDGIGPDYQHWGRDDVMQFVAAWAPRTRGWMACMTSHDLIGAYQDAYEAVDRYAFAPVPIVMRVSGDGPSSWAVYLMVARPRTGEFAKWGTLPGAYVGSAEPGASKGRGKPSWLLDEIVRDYTREGDLVCDPLAGWGSTLFAALRLGRRAIGAELDREAHAAATAAAKQPIT